jgi:membrane protein implicated in regulation of membrane protease activity
MELWHFWIIAGIILLILEIFTPGFLLASFGIGALGGAFIAYLGVDLKYQLLTFSITTMVVFFGLRPAFKQWFGRFDDQRTTGTGALIGTSCRVVETIDNAQGQGSVQIGGEVWKAHSVSGEIIDPGQVVTVTKIVGVTAHVAPRAN